MDPLTITSFALTSFSLVLSMGIEMYKFVKQNRHNDEGHNNQNHICHGHGVLYVEEYKEQKLHAPHKKKGNHHTYTSEETQLPCIIEDRQNNSMNLSGDQEELTSE